MTETIESWRDTFRRGFVPILSTRGLEALAEALRTNDPRLTQGSTTTPPPLMCMQDWPVEAGCALGFCGAVENGGFGEATVGQAELFFAKACFVADVAMGEPAACRYFLNWFDDTPRHIMFPLLLEEVERAIAERQKGAAA